jgi:uncharacterized membrane protein YozB (DUF420 family)
MRKLIGKFSWPIFCLVNWIATVQQTKAQDTNSFSVSTYLTTAGQGNVKNMLKPGVPVIAAYIVRLINYLALVIGSFAFLTIVIGGFLMVTSAGREQQINKGKDMITYAIMGVLVALSAYFITAFVQSIFYEIPSAVTH